MNLFKSKKLALIFVAMLFQGLANPAYLNADNAPVGSAADTTTKG